MVSVRGAERLRGAGEHLCAAPHHPTSAFGRRAAQPHQSAGDPEAAFRTRQVCRPWAARRARASGQGAPS